MTGLEKIPGPSQSSLVKLCTEEEKVPLLLVLGTRPIAKEVQNRHLWVCGLHIVQCRFQMFPYGSWTLVLGWWDGGKAGWLLGSTNIDDPCVKRGLLVGWSKVYWLNFSTVLTRKVPREVNVDKAFIIGHAAAQSTVIGLLLPDIEEMPLKFSEGGMEPLYKLLLTALNGLFYCYFCDRALFIIWFCFVFWGPLHIGHLLCTIIWVWEGIISALAVFTFSIHAGLAANVTADKFCEAL